jgi:hypothetical protein
VQNTGSVNLYRKKASKMVYVSWMITILCTFKPQKDIEKLKLRVYAYYLDNRSSEEFWGTVVGKWRHLKSLVLNHVRSDVSLRNKKYAGWHFTSQGGFAEFKRKLDSSYSEEDYYSPEIKRHLAERHFSGVDFLGRNFTFTVDASEWPQFLNKNRKDYAHLCRGVSKQAISRRSRRPIQKESY